MTKRDRSASAPVNGVVAKFDAEEGWGAIQAPETPGGCFVHFSGIQMSGYRMLRPGQSVRFTYEQARQDGYNFRATAVWPQD